MTWASFHWHVLLNLFTPAFGLKAASNWEAAVWAWRTRGKRPAEREKPLHCEFLSAEGNLRILPPMYIYIYIYIYTVDPHRGRKKRRRLKAGEKLWFVATAPGPPLSCYLCLLTCTVDTHYTHTHTHTLTHTHTQTHTHTHSHTHTHTHTHITRVHAHPHTYGPGELLTINDKLKHAVWLWAV